MQTTVFQNKLFRVQLIAVVIGALLLVAKFSAYLFTQSNSILTDALESIINVVAGSVALLSLYISSKPKDEDHPYGHGKVEFLSAGFEGVLIGMAGFVIIWKSIFAFFHPKTIEHLDWGLLVVIVSGVINFGVGWWIEKSGKEAGSLALEADGKHLKSDAYSSAGLMVGIVLIIVTGWQWLDNVVAVIFGFVIMFTGYKLVRQSLRGIMDEADEKAIKAMIELLNSHRKPVWIDIHNLRIIQYGSKLHVDCHATLPWYFTLEQAHDEMEEIANTINEKYGTQVEFFIHGDPCIEASCKICSIEDCKVRKHPFTERMEWTVENVLRNKKHGL
jgi:cation diffusion facilitator family transporter